MSPDDQAAFDHAWRHFALHADQRISVFNFYVASSGLLLTGLAYVLANAPKLWPMGVAAGLLIVGLSLVFWKLDQRSAQMIKVSEAVMELVEAGAFPPERRVLSLVANLPVNAAFYSVRRPWTFGHSFRSLFLGVAALGMLGGTLAAVGWNGTPSKIGSSSETQVDRTTKSPRVGRTQTGAKTEPIGNSPSNVP